MLFCYLKIIIRIRSTRKTMDCETVEHSKFFDSEVEKKSIVKIANYIFIFSIHWIPILIQNLGRLLNVKYIIFIAFFLCLSLNTMF